jgi:hypothetical protein
MRGNLISLETKAKMKDRTRRSPDVADADVVTAQVAAARCKLSPNDISNSEDRPDSPWKRFLVKRNLSSEYVSALPY